jgi:hypothetical protein
LFEKVITTRGLSKRSILKESKKPVSKESKKIFQKEKVEKSKKVAWK